MVRNMIYKFTYTWNGNEEKIFIMNNSDIKINIQLHLLV